MNWQPNAKVWTLAIVRMHNSHHTTCPRYDGSRTEGYGEPWQAFCRLIGQT